MDEGFRQHIATMTVKKGRLLGALLGEFSFLTTYAFYHLFFSACRVPLHHIRPESKRIASGSLVSVLVEFTS